MKAKKITELALLSTIALTIFIVELRIPNLIPIPGVKLGLANIVTVYAVYRYSAKETFSIILTRILLGAFFSGNMMSLLYSAAGGMFCFVGMLSFLPFLMISGCLAGAFTGGCAQMILNRDFLRKVKV